MSHPFKELREMILSSISSIPCYESELKKRDFLKNISEYGISRAIHCLIQDGKLFEKEKNNGDDDMFLCAYNSPFDLEDLKVGHIYKGKRRTKVYEDIFFGARVYNDRRIIAITHSSIQYDSPSTRVGYSRPMIDINEFLNWVKADVTNESENGNWILVKD